MIRHTVMFQLVAELEGDARVSKCKEICDSLNALMGQIPSLKSIDTRMNVNPAEQYDIVLVTTHDDMDGLKNYAVHPLHVAVSKELIRPVLQSRACVDVEI